MADLDRLTYRTRPARAEQPRGLIVLFHGRGADENDLYPLIDMLDPDGNFIGVTPRGPLSLAPGGAHWYVVRRVGFPDPETWHNIYERASNWLAALTESTGVPIAKTVLGGFSQGAVMACALSLGGGRPRPAGLMAFSGFLPTVPGWEADLSDLDGWPAAVGHGVYDPVIGIEWGRDLRDRLTEAGVVVVYKESPMPHVIDPELVYELRPWLAAVVGSSAHNRA